LLLLLLLLGGRRGGEASSGLRDSDWFLEALNDFFEAGGDLAWGREGGREGGGALLVALGIVTDFGGLERFP